MNILNNYLAKRRFRTDVLAHIDRLKGGLVTAALSDREKRDVIDTYFCGDDLTVEWAALGVIGFGIENLMRTMPAEELPAMLASIEGRAPRGTLFAIGLHQVLEQIAAAPDEFTRELMREFIFNRLQPFFVGVSREEVV